MALLGLTAFLETGLRGHLRVPFVTLWSVAFQQVALYCALPRGAPVAEGLLIPTIYKGERGSKSRVLREKQVISEPLKIVS